MGAKTVKVAVEAIAPVKKIPLSHEQDIGDWFIEIDNKGGGKMVGQNLIVLANPSYWRQ